MRRDDRRESGRQYNKVCMGCREWQAVEHCAASAESTVKCKSSHMVKMIYSSSIRRELCLIFDD